MTVLRFLSLAALAVWIGGLGVLGGIVAPDVFAVLEGLDPAGGRETAGAVFGAVFQHFLIVSLICGGLLLVLLATRAALGPRPPRMRVRVWTVIGMIAISAATVSLIVPRIDRLRRDVSAPMASLPDDDPRKITFGRLHGASNGLMLLVFAGGLGLFWLEARENGEN